MNIEKPIPTIKLRQEILEQLTPQIVKYINTNSNNSSARKVTFLKEEIAEKIEKMLRKNPKMTIQNGINNMKLYREEAMYGLENMA